MFLAGDGEREDEFLCDVDGGEPDEAGEDAQTNAVAAPATHTAYVVLSRRYELAGDAVETMQVDYQSGEAYGENWQGELLVAELAHLDQCPACGGDWRSTRGRREVRVSGPFTLGTVIPELLRAAPPDPDVGNGPNVLLQGRRLLAFTDSRQGTARGAVRLYDRSLREFVRSAVPHALAEARSRGESAAERDDLAKEKEDYAALLASANDEAQRQRWAARLAAVEAKLAPTQGQMSIPRKCFILNCCDYLRSQLNLLVFNNSKRN